MNKDKKFIMLPSGWMLAIDHIVAVDSSIPDKITVNFDVGVNGSIVSHDFYDVDARALKEWMYCDEKLIEYLG